MMSSGMFVSRYISPLSYYSAFACVPIACSESFSVLTVYSMDSSVLDAIPDCNSNSL